MNNHTYLTGTLPSSQNTTVAAINSQIPSTTSNNFQFMSPATDQFSRIRPSTSLANTPLYNSQQHIGMTDENGGKNMISAYSIQQHITADHHTQRAWDMIQKHYDLGLVEPMGTSSSSSPTSVGVISANSTPPLYQEMISPTTSSTTSTQAIDSSQQHFRLQHPQSQMVPVDTSSRNDNTPNARNKFFLESVHGAIDAFGDAKSNEQKPLQRQNNNSKPAEQEDQITHQLQQQQSLHLSDSSLSASGSNLPSSSVLSSDLQRDQHPTNPSNQQKLVPASASSNHHKTPDHHIQSDPCNSKRLHQDCSAPASKALGTPLMKKPKTDVIIQHASQQRKAPTSASTSLSSTTTFTAAAFEHMTREQMIERLIFLENERLDLQHQLEQTQQGQGVKNPKTINTDTANEDATAKNNKTGDDDDDDDDEVESISSGPEINSASDDKTEMKCLWKNCGIIRVGIRDLTDHIVSAHVGGGKPLYRCEWENCRRSHKPFTKRHKICNHLRVHTGERPFVCDKPGCEKRFSRLDSLTTHIKTHSTVRPFICHIPGCKKEYYHARSLKKHLKLHEDEMAKENELANNTLDTSNSNINPPPVSFTSATSSSDPQLLQQPNQHHPYPFVEGISLPQFLLQPGSNITSASIHNEQQMIDQSIIDPAQSLFDPLAFQTLSSLPMEHNQSQQQQQQQQQPQFMQQLSESISQVGMPASSNHNINMMDTLQQQQQHQPNEGYGLPHPILSSQPPMSQDGFCL